MIDTQQAIYDQTASLLAELHAMENALAEAMWEATAPSMRHTLRMGINRDPIRMGVAQDQPRQNDLRIFVETPVPTFWCDLPPRSA